MLMHEIKDIVREYAGKTGMPTAMLDLSLQNGRLNIEKYQNFWWMSSDIDFQTSNGVRSYSITEFVTDGLNIPDFKDGRDLKYKEVNRNDWQPVDYGTQLKEYYDSLYYEDQEGPPEHAIVEDTNLFFYPIPDGIYDLRFYYWRYTTNPANQDEDDVTKFFPMALVYASYKWIHEVYLKDQQGAIYWNGLLYGKEGELVKMRRENFKRGWKDKVNFQPSTGPGRGSRKRVDRMQIYR